MRIGRIIRNTISHLSPSQINAEKNNILVRRDMVRFFHICLPAVNTTHATDRSANRHSSAAGFR